MILVTFCLILYLFYEQHYEERIDNKVKKNIKLCIAESMIR